MNDLQFRHRIHRTSQSVIGFALMAIAAISCSIAKSDEEILFKATPLPIAGFNELIEGPACDAAGNLFCVGFGPAENIVRVTPDGKAEVFVTLPKKSFGNGIVFDKAGMMYVADYSKHNVLKIDPNTKQVSTLVHEPKMNQPNDLAIAPDGTLYASDPNWKTSVGQVWKITPKGEATLLAGDMGTTNGIEVSPDGKTLYVNESVQRNIWSFDLTATRPTKKLFKKFDDFGFDGMRCDAEGNLYVTRYGKGVVAKISPKGEVLREIDVLGKSPSNLCFGGPDGRTLYVTEVEHKRLVKFRVDQPGLAWKRWQEAAKTSAVAPADPADTLPALHLIPWPKSIDLKNGAMRLSNKSRIVATDESLKPLASVLSEEIATLIGITLTTTTDHPRDGDIVLRLNNKLVAGEPILTLKNREPIRTTDGAHRITIDKQAVVEGFDYRAAAEGTATILQLVTRTGDGFELPAVAIHDWPHADYCGAMLDVARQDHPIDSIKKVVQLCRLYKGRYLQLHLTDDQGWTFPSTKYPQLGSKNGAAHGGIPPRVYKLAELRELVAYADARGVTLVPELELPGHSGAALRSLSEVFDAIDPVSKQPVGMGCMNMSNEAIYPALDTIIGEMCDVFKSSPYFHIGSDEVSAGRVSLHPGYKAFMQKHGLKNDNDLADHFIREACAIVKKHGKKAIKWEGLANEATKDVIIMAWDGHSTVASTMIAKGYTTITCPWNLEVPWEDWNMYVCNGSRLKRGDSVIGATLVAWEQPPLKHISMLRNLAARQERTWGPDNRVSVAGFAWRFQPLDAVAGKLIGMPVKPRLPATFSTSIGQSDFLEPALAFDGNDETFFRSADVPKPNDHFTLNFDKPILIHDLDILTGQNGRGLGNGIDLQVSSDGSQFSTIATLANGTASAKLRNNLVKSIRLLATASQSEPVVVREFRIRQMVELAGQVRNVGKTIGDGNIGILKTNATLAYPIGECKSPLMNTGHTLTINNEGNSAWYSGPISGTGSVEIVAFSRKEGSQDAALVLAGNDPNTLNGAWSIKRGVAILAKPNGVEAMSGTIEVGSDDHSGAVILHADQQIGDQSRMHLRAASSGGSMLDLAGFQQKLARLVIDRNCSVNTSELKRTGRLSVAELIVDGKAIAPGVYGRGESWVTGNGYVIVGSAKAVAIAGDIADPNKAIGPGNLAELSAAATLRLSAGNFDNAIETKSFVVTIAARSGATIRGMIAGTGGVRYDGTTTPDAAALPIVLAGDAANTYQGSTTVVGGVLRLAKPAGGLAVPHDLILEGTPSSKNAMGVVWAADGQLAPSATISVSGNQSAFLDIGTHQVKVAKVNLSSASTIRIAQGGSLTVLQLWIDGKRLADGVYRSPQPWLAGEGQVNVDSRVNIAGNYGMPDDEIGRGNTANMTGNVMFGYPMSGTAIDVINNGHRLVLDSGDGNGFAYLGSIQGKGEVEFFMGPSYTGFRDAPMHLGGDKPSTMQGVFRVRKGRVSLEKPVGVDAISSDVVVGGQGFNDCLFWQHSHQVKDTAHITLKSAGNNGAAYLHLNGCDESAASLTMTGRNLVKTDSTEKKSGTLTVKSLKIDDDARPAGVYTSATEKWIEGNGKVVVRP